MLPQTKKWLRANNYSTYVLGVIKGKKVYLTELDVRYIQVLCKNCSNNEQFEQFKKDYIIYDGKTKKCRKMVFTKGGYFDEPFTCGLFSANKELSKKLMY